MSESSSIYFNIRKYLESLIAQNQNDPLFMLPSEKQLSLRFDCSRIPAQRALRDLKNDGVIYRIQGKGSFITQHGKSAPYMKKSVCLLVPDLTKRFSIDIIQSIQAQFRIAGINLFVSTTQDISQMEEQMIDAAVSKQFDGLMIFPVVNEDFKKTLLNLVIKKYPIVFIGRNIPGINASSISSDHYVQTKTAMDYLFSKKHRRIGFITEKAESSYCYADRIRAYSEFMSKKSRASLHLCEIDFFTERETEASRRMIDESVAQFFKKNLKLTAVLTTNLAVESICAIADADPERCKDLDVMIFDHPETSPWPSLQKWTVVDQQPYEMGRIAAEQMIHQLNRRTPSQQIICEPKIVSIMPKKISEYPGWC